MRRGRAWATTSPSRATSTLRCCSPPLRRSAAGPPRSSGSRPSAPATSSSWATASFRRRRWITCGRSSTPYTSCRRARPRVAFGAVLWSRFAAPTRPEEIRPFLANVTRGRRIPPERLDVVAHHYEQIGGRSPLNELTFRQADGLRRALNDSGVPLSVYVGMRNWEPYLADVLAEMADAGIRRALGLILSPQ